MIRSMYTAVSGLRSHQTMMDVVGDNIANVNTAGFKKNQVVFADLLSQTAKGASSPTEGLGGTNPAQVGLGVRVASIAKNLSQGPLQQTGRDLDMSIEGDGFFVLEYAGERTYTRAGAFFLDSEGSMTSSDGGLVQGWQADGSGEIDTTASVGSLKIPVGAQIAPTPTSYVSLGGNLSAGSEIGDTTYAGLDIYDLKGNAIAVSLNIEKTDDDEWTITGTYGDDAEPLDLVDNILTFGPDGELVTPADLSINIEAGAIPNGGDVEMVIGGTGERRFTQFGGSTSINAINQNGSATGSLQSISVGQDGIVSGSYSNGKVLPIAQIALATFSNAEGLDRVSGSSFRASTNSGLAQIGTVGSGGRGLMASGKLEMSNVDLAEEFTQLIRAQRGFQANSRVVTASDELLQEIVNLKR